VQAHGLQVEHAKQFINEKFVPRLRGAAHKVLLSVSPHQPLPDNRLLATCRHCCHRLAFANPAKCSKS
jgi:hypothetical protein